MCVYIFDIIDLYVRKNYIVVVGIPYELIHKKKRLYGENRPRSITHNVNLEKVISLLSFTRQYLFHYSRRMRFEFVRQRPNVIVNKSPCSLRDPFESGEYFISRR